MEQGYRLVFSGRSIYNEINVTSDRDVVGIGTISGCRARFSKDIFNQDFLVTVTKTDKGWHFICEAGVFFVHNGKKKTVVYANQGEYVSLYSLITETELFKISCYTNYEEGSNQFNARLALANIQQLIIGNTDNSTVFLHSLVQEGESFTLHNAGNYLRLSVSKSLLGVYVNGYRVVGRTRINNGDFISFGSYRFFFSNAYLYFSDSDTVSTDYNLEDVIESSSALKYPKFNRSTRVKRIFSKEPISILDPPNNPEKPTESFIMTFLPAAITFVIAIVSRVVLPENASMTAILGLGSMAVGITMSVVNFFKARKKYSESVVNRKEVYDDYIKRKIEEISLARREERKGLLEEYPDFFENYKRTAEFSGSLFDRTTNDEDFLQIRLGTGDRKAYREISYKTRDSLTLGDDLQNIPEKIAEEYACIKDAPIVLDLKKAGILGIVGNEGYSLNLLKSMIVDMCCRQFYEDLSLFIICTEDQINRIDWTRFLPHFQSDTDVGRNLAYDDESCDLLFDYLLRVLTQRENISSKKAEYPSIVVLVLDQMGLYSHPVSKYLKQAKDYGVYFVFLVENREELPLYCGNMVFVESETNAKLIDSSDQTNVTPFTFSQIEDRMVEAVALKLSPVYCETVSVEGTLPKSFSLFTMLGIQGADDLDLKSRWKKNDITQTMAAPIGLGSRGEIVYLDIHEKYHGPHGLVAGTTGSGKSELLQTYVLSMATLYSPEEVGFFIIDFKGGGMADLFSDLPHLMGAITDIDGKSINRSLMAIRAEIDKRKRWFSEAEVNNIGEYIKKYRAQTEKRMKPLPHLILIIDEFAELKAEQPEFMKEVSSAARVGRSLGIHLILATQKPSGIIDNQTWSNSRFKLCLKVQSQNDSNEVLKTPVAAEIREPGRAYLQVGNNEIFELFQSAYSGGPAQSEEMDHIKPFKLFEVDLCGRKKVIYEKTSSINTDDEREETQLEAIISKISQYCEKSNIQRMPSICLPPLPASIDFPDLKENDRRASKYTVTIGSYDDPSTQAQYPVEIDVSVNNLLVIGASQSGKSTLLMTIIRSLATVLSPKDVNMYILDFGPSILSNFQELPHVGGVINESDEEKVKNLFKLLNAEIMTRKQKIMNARVSSFSAYQDAGYTDMPLIVLFVDNYSAFKELYLSNEDFLLPICRNGLSAGISVIVANQNMQGINYRYSSSFSKRIALHCNDISDYASVIDRCRIYPDSIPGRAVTSIDKDIYEMQVFNCFSGERESEKADEQARFIEFCLKKAENEQAKQIPMVPDQLSMEFIQRRYSLNGHPANEVVLGLDYESISPVLLNLETAGAVGTVGKASAESRLFIKNVIEQVDTENKDGVELYLLDSSRKELQQYKDRTSVKMYSTDTESFSNAIEGIYSEVVERYNECARNDYAILESKPLLLIVVNGSETVATFCKNMTAVNKYKEILDRYSDMKVCFIYLNLDNTDEGYSVEILKRLRNSKAVYFFDRISKLKFVQVAQSYLRTSGAIQPLDGYCFIDGDPVRFKLIN